MTLPFLKDDGKKKYCCFVCGQMFTTQDLFKSHVLDHEEGKDYVLCPLARCQTPCRDIKLHFKACHPFEELPKNLGQVRATVWRDKTKSGKMKGRKPKFRTGSIISIKNNGKEMTYRSGYECDVYECLEAMPEIYSYDVEPFTVKYSFEGECHDYHPDLIVTYMDGTVEVWEIKPMNQTTLPRNLAKWEACGNHCKARGWLMKIITEVAIDKLKKHVKSLLHD